MNEASFTISIHKKLSHDIYKWKIRDDFCGGVPDAFYRSLIAKSAPLWIEYKYVKTFPKKPNTIIKPNLSKQQRHWLDMADKAGENVLVIVGFDDSKKSLVLKPQDFDGVIASDAIHRLIDREATAQLIYDVLHPLSLS